MTELDRIADQMKRAHEGGAWHGPSVKEVLNGVTASRAASRPISGAHSIWEIALHIASWRNTAAVRLSGQPVHEPPDGDWPAVGSVDEASWEDVHDLLERRYVELTEAVRRFEPTRIDLPLGEGFSTAYVTMHGVIHHDLYHAAQVSLLKKT